MKLFKILHNGMIKVYSNNQCTATLFNSDKQIKGLLLDGYIQISK